ncbi:hypothetical protein D9758_015494 [Tetrapyrgos nigripes]|uniref:Uncharacterized protein n=1 Tax=Tetrapyrgos nigripes TaxID=182062 RepID=A0A8H5FC83_9AGAR|nr:hypothetical protein D9758_015494 [Tetrapyrgos nigripes]
MDNSLGRDASSIWEQRLEGYLHLCAIAWEALFAYDTVIFALTLRKAYEMKSFPGDLGLLQVILRDDCVYFAVMALTNLANILSYYFCGPYMRGGLSTFASAYVHLQSFILVDSQTDIQHL